MSRKSRRTKTEEEDSSVRRCARLVADPCRVLKKAGFCIWPSTAQLTFPTSNIDFDIPDDWKTSSKTPAVKLPQYRSLVKNFYRAPLQRGKCDPDDIPQCSCSQESGCDMHCQNRQLFMECVIGDCKSIANCHQKGYLEETKVLPYCLNTSVQRRSYPKCEVFKTDACGFGLKVSDNVPRGTIIVEYTGEVITSSECSDRMRGMKEHEDFYFASLGGGLMLDAKRMGSVARFANHSCEPNCDLQKWSVLGESCIVLVSKKDITAGTEMTYNYQYYNDGMDCMVRMKRQKCLCGAKRCSGTIGGRVVASDADAWLKKASVLLCGNRKYSLETLNDHIKSSEKCGVDSSCKELQSLKDMILEANLWNAQRSDLFQKAVRENVLLDSEECMDLLNRCPSGVRLEEWIVLDSLVRNVLRIEKVIKSLKGIAGTAVEKCSVSEISGLMCSTGCTALLDKGEAGGVSVVESESSIVDSLLDAPHMDEAHHNVEDVVKIPHADDTHTDPVTLQTHQINEKPCYNEKNYGTQVLSLVKCATEDIAESISTEGLTPLRASNVYNSDISLSISGHDQADMRCLLDTRVAKVDIASRNEKNEGLSLIDYTIVHSASTSQLKSIHWDEFATLLKDVASVLPIRCDRCEVLLEMYSDVNAWVKDHIGGLLHHSPNSRLQTSSSTSSSTSMSISNFSSSASTSTSTSSLHSSALPIVPSPIEHINHQTSKVVEESTDLNKLSLDVLKMNPLAAILSKISSVYRSTPLDLTLFIAEDFLQFRLGLYMERQDALRGEGKSIEIAESRRNLSLPVSSMAPLPQQLGGDDKKESDKKESDMICFCMMPAAMGETPVLSQCDSCDRWYHPNCINAFLVSRTASQCAQTFECPLCLHKKGKPSNLAFKPALEWKVSIHSFSDKRAKGSDQGVSSSTLPDSDHRPKINNPKESDLLASKKIRKNMEQGVRDTPDTPLRKKVKTHLSGKDRSKPNIKSESNKNDRQQDPVGSCDTPALPDPVTAGIPFSPYNHTALMQSIPTSSSEVSSAIDSSEIDKKDSLLSLPVLEAGVIAMTTSNAHSNVANGLLTADFTVMTATAPIPALVSTPVLSVAPVPAPIHVPAPVPAPILSVAPIHTDSERDSHSAVPKGIVNSSLKRVKVAVRKPSNDPMTLTDVRCAALAGKKLRSQKSPPSLLLGLCSVFIDEWRGRARSFLVREDVQYVVRGGHLTEKPTESAFNHTSQLSQCDNYAAPSSSLGGNLEREALLLQECLQLYFEPRLLRIKPAETLDLRALAFLISASTVLNPHTLTHTHTPGVPSGLQGSLSSGPVHGTGDGTGDVEDPDPSKQSQGETSPALISIRELKLVIEGGNYFLKQLKQEMSKREDIPSNLARTDMTSVSSASSKSDTALSIIKTTASQVEQSSELENLCRERLRDRIYHTVITVSCRLDKCMKMLRVASEYHSKRSTRHKYNGNLLFNAVSEVDSFHPTVTENILYPMERSQKEESSAVNNDDEIFKIDDALETACHGICMKEQYEYVRLKNILLRECKNVPWNMDMNMNIVQDSTLKRLKALGYFQTSTDNIQRWCWCRGVDDGRPMVQCDGCDEWFHSLCMGLCKSSSSSSSQSKSSKKTLPSIKEEGVLTGPLSASSSTVIMDNNTVSQECMGGVQVNAVKKETKRKGKIKVKQEKKTLEEINEKVNCMFYCIACSEEREDDYPFAWTSDNS